MEKFTEFLRRTGFESKPFQIECLKWCMNREKTAALPPPIEKRGGILSLEMGLGKTIIMLALIECNLKRHTLIVLPLSLLNQWEKIIKEKFGHQPLVYHSSRPKSKKMSLADINERPIVITTYGQISIPSEKQANRGLKKSILHDITWNRIICDEGHNVSHEQTNEYKGVRALKTDIIWLVTGTPIQNNEAELYNMYRLFCSLSFQKNDYNFGNNYNDVAQEIVFFRTKSDVKLVIPKLNEYLIDVDWENNDELNFASHIHSMLTMCNIPREKAALFHEIENGAELPLLGILRARQVCINPLILKKNFMKYKELLTSVGEETKVNFTALKSSHSKINAVVKTLMERLSNGCGKIVFCHFYNEIDVIEQYIRIQDPNSCIRIAKFDGRLPSNKREKVLNEPVDILLAQIKMCREGLNLQKDYSEVYFPSPDFNPAVEEQSIARCWRIGQEKPVNVFHYIMKEPVTKALSITKKSETNEVNKIAYSLDTYSIKLHRIKKGYVDRLRNATIKIKIKKTKKN
jgi:SNF2 family DNA or RNA helicase